MDNEEIARADKAVVRALCNHLIHAFEEFYNSSPTPVDYVDGFMAVHNFHVQIVLDLEARIGMDHNDKLFWRKIALDTFKKALEERP